MTRLVQLSRQDLGIHHPLVGATTFDANGERLGTVDSLIVDDETRKPRYLVIDSGGLLRSKQFLVPVGVVERVDEEQQTASLRSVTRAQLGSETYPSYDARWWTADEQDRFAAHERAVAATFEPTREATAAVDYSGPLFQPAAGVAAQLQLLEERLTLRTERVQVGAVRVSKRITSRTETVEVPLTEVHLVIERTAGDGSVIVDGKPLRPGETVEIPLFSERVLVTKEPVVAEQVSIRTEPFERTEQVAETLRREELVVNQTADGLSTVLDGTGTAVGSTVQP